MAQDGWLARLLSADAVAPARLQRLYRETTVPASLPETFAFFADASNLERLTPPWLRFTILTAMPLAMGPGVDIDYRIGIYGLPIPWRSRIDVWEPGVRFVDREVVGPYRWWHHEHRFEQTAGGTLVIDEVHYAPRAGWISSSLVRRDLARIFSYRQKALTEIFRRR